MAILRIAKMGNPILQQIAEPLFAAGWTLVSAERDVSWEHGDSVFYDLERGGVVIELEYYEQFAEPEFVERQREHEAVWHGDGSGA